MEKTYLVEGLLNICNDVAVLQKMPEGPEKFLMESYLATKQSCPSEGELIRIMGAVNTTEVDVPFGLREYPSGTVGLGVRLPFGQNQWGETDTWLVETGAILLGMNSEGLNAGDEIAALCHVGEVTKTGMALFGFELNDCELEEVLAKIPPTPTRIPWTERDTYADLPTPTPQEVRMMQPRIIPLPIPEPLYKP